MTTAFPPTTWRGSLIQKRSLSFTRILSHTHTHTQRHPHPHIHTHSLTLSLSHSLTPSLPHSLTLSLPQQVWSRWLNKPVEVDPQILVMYGHTAPIQKVRFSSDGLRIISGSLDASVRPPSFPLWPSLSLSLFLSLFLSLALSHTHTPHRL